MKVAGIIFSVISGLALIGSISQLADGDTGNGIFGLVVFIVCGLIAVLLLIKQSKKRKSTPTRPQTVPYAASTAVGSTSQDNSECIFKVAGVTFSNRQKSLKGIFDIGGWTEDVIFENYDYKGSPAIRVFLDGSEVGNIPADAVAQFLAIQEKGIIGVRADVDVFDNDDDDGESKEVYYCSLTVACRK